MTRRGFLHAAGLAVLTTSWPLRSTWAEDDVAPLRALQSSPLVYLSPTKRDGSESRCHGEVWFVMDGGDIMVVTTPDRWRARALRAGLEHARLWVGDFGVWRRAKGRYLNAPNLEVRARFEHDRAAQTRALEAFGKKYAAEWAHWGPRFHAGLESGSRVLIRYTPIA